MTLQEAIVARHSVRQYMEKPIESEKVARSYRCPPLCAAIHGKTYRIGKGRSTAGLD